MPRQVHSTARERAVVPVTAASLGKMPFSTVCLMSTRFGCGSSERNIGITTSTVTTIESAQNEA